MGTTPDLALRYPEPADAVTNGATAVRNLAEDVEAALAGELAGVARIASGTYTGDGTTDRTIALPFTPKLVLVAADWLAISRLAVGYSGFRLSTTPTIAASSLASQVPVPVSGGFQVSGSGGSELNGTGQVRTYLALG